MSAHQPRHWFLTYIGHYGVVRLAIHLARDAEDAQCIAAREMVGVHSEQVWVDRLDTDSSRALLCRWFRRDYVSDLRRDIDILAPWVFTYGHTSI